MGWEGTGWVTMGDGWSHPARGGGRRPGLGDGGIAGCGS